MISYTLKQGDDVLLIVEQRGDGAMQSNALSVTEIARLARNRPAVMYCRDDEREVEWQITYTFEETVEMLWVTARKSAEGYPDRLYKVAVGLAVWLPPYGTFVIGNPFGRWVEISGARPFTTDPNMPDSFVPNALGAPYTGYATLIGEDPMLGWSLCRMPDGTHSVFSSRDVQFVVSKIDTPEQGYLVAELVNAV